MPCGIKWIACCDYVRFDTVVVHGTVTGEASDTVSISHSPYGNDVLGPVCCVYAVSEYASGMCERIELMLGAVVRAIRVSISRGAKILGVPCCPRGDYARCPDQIIQRSGANGIAP